MSRRPAPRRIGERTVTTAIIDVNAITTVELAPDSVTTQILAPDSVTTEILAPDSVTTQILAPDSVTTEILAPDSVTTAILAPDSVTTEILAPDSVTTEILAPDSVTTEILAPDSVTTEILAPGAVTIEIIDEAAQDELGGIDSSVSPTAPANPDSGDFWIDTSDSNNLKRWDGSSWVSVRDFTISVAQAAATAAQTTADGKNRVFRQPSAPTASAIGDLWFDTDDDNRIYRWNGSSWVANNLGNNAIQSLSANKITAGTIDASVITVSNIDAGNITAGTIASSRIIASSIAAGVIDASKITAGTLGAAVVYAGTVAAGNITAGTLSASVVYAGTINADNITSGTLTGRTVQTASEGNRVILSSSTNALSFQVNSTSVAHITPLTVEGVGYGLVMHHGASADSSASAYPQVYIGNDIISLGASPLQLLSVGAGYMLASAPNAIEFASDIFRVQVGPTTFITRGVRYETPNLPVYLGQRWGISWNYLNGPVGGFSGGQLVMCVDNNVGIRGFVPWTNPSDRRLKEDVVEVGREMLDNLYGTRAYTFRYNDTAPESVRGRYGVGVIADEVASAFPYAIRGEATEEGLCYRYDEHPGGFTEEEMVTFGADSDYTFTEEGVWRRAQYQAVDYTSMVPVLISAVRDLNTRLKALEEG
jgi:hypothetical protein